MRSMNESNLRSLTSAIQDIASPFRTYLVDLHEKYQSLTEGKPANPLAGIEPPEADFFGVCIATVDGQVYEVGHCHQPFAIQALSRALLYGLALEDHGREQVSHYVGIEPYRELETLIGLNSNKHRPHNPLTDTGAIVIAGLIQGDSLVSRFKRVMAMLSRYAGRDISTSLPVFLSQKEQGEREQAIAHLMVKMGLVQCPITDVLDLYFQCSSVMVNSRDLAVIAATLANGGLNPVTGERAIHEQYIQDVISVILTCGMHDSSGEWTYQVGIPAQAESNGGVMGIVPQKQGIGIFSPRLDDHGNSSRGMKVCQDLATDHHLHVFNIYEKNQQMAKYIEQVEKITAAAIAVRQGTFAANSLDSVVQRPDELGELARVFTNMVETIQAREQELSAANRQLEALVNAYGRFVPHEYLKFLHKDSIVDVELGDYVSTEMAVMFSDIRSFTALSEYMTPQESFDFINAYLGHVGPEIHRYHGITIKYLGDGLMAVFPSGIDDAIAAGLAKLKRLQDYNRQRQAAGEPCINIGIGIHVGHMMIGIIGESNRMQGDAFSGTITLTARLEGLTKYYGVHLLVSEEALNQLQQPTYQFRFLDRAIVKGRTEPVGVYEVLNAEPAPIQALKQETAALFDAGIQHYCQGNFIKATACFKQVVTVNPLDQTARLYLNRIQQLHQEGIPNNWTGIWTFTQK